MARPERKRSEKKYIKWNIEHGMTNPTTKNKYKKIYHIQKNSYMHIYAYCTFCVHVVLMYIHDIAPTVYYYYEVNDVCREIQIDGRVQPCGYALSKRFASTYAYVKDTLRCTIIVMH